MARASEAMPALISGTTTFKQSIERKAGFNSRLDRHAASDDESIARFGCNGAFTNV
jgi:hypothetical protein